MLYSVHTTYYLNLVILFRNVCAYRWLDEFQEACSKDRPKNETKAKMQQKHERKNACHKKRKIRTKPKIDVRLVTV